VTVHRYTHCFIPKEQFHHHRHQRRARKKKIGGSTLRGRISNVPSEQNRNANEQNPNINKLDPNQWATKLITNVVTISPNLEEAAQKISMGGALIQQIRTVMT
jgi:hypothetical protein